MKKKEKFSFEKHFCIPPFQRWSAKKGSQRAECKDMNCLLFYSLKHTYTIHWMNISWFDSVWHVIIALFSLSIRLHSTYWMYGTLVMQRARTAHTYTNIFNCGLINGCCECCLHYTWSNRVVLEMFMMLNFNCNRNRFKLSVNRKRESEKKS